MLTGKRSDTPKPEAILLVLDSTNLGRHLMLAAPILSLGVPTLVILNMADDLRSREGKVDLAALSAELGAPVALISARRGEGDREGLRLPHRRHAQAGAERTAGPAGRAQVPGVGWTRERAGRLPPADRAQVDPPAGFRLPASVSRARGIRGGRGGGLPDHLQRGRSFQGCGRLAGAGYRQLGCICPAGVAAPVAASWTASGRASAR